MVDPWLGDGPHPYIEAFDPDSPLMWSKWEISAGSWEIDDSR